MIGYNQKLDVYREPTTEEILEFPEGRTLFGYIEIHDTLGVIDVKRSKTKSWHQAALKASPGKVGRKTRKQYRTHTPHGYLLARGISEVSRTGHSGIDDPLQQKALS